MRKVILQAIVSLDGYAAGPNDDVSFIPASTRGDQRWGAEQMRLFESVDTMLLGRVTYQIFSQFWPTRTEGEEKPFADMFNAVPKIVFSKTLTRAPWGSWPEARIVKTDPGAEIARLKRESGKSILISGSISIGQQLSDAKLVDEYHIIVCPVVLGAGRALFPENRARQLELIDAHPLTRGAVSML